jgi:hypothetical protein
MIVSSFVHEFILAPAGPRNAAVGIMGIWLMDIIPNRRPQAAARTRKMTPAGQPASTSAPLSTDVDIKSILSFQPTERSQQ